LPEGSEAVYGRSTDSAWRERAIRCTTEAGPPVIWVQDIQTHPPLARAGEDEFEGIGEQLAGLRAIAQQTQAIIAVGHCMPVDFIDGYEVILHGVDDTFVIDEEVTSDDRGLRRATVEHHTQDAPAEEFERQIDTQFAAWRSVHMQRVEARRQQSDSGSRG
jgi:hypothetical protein